MNRMLRTLWDLDKISALLAGLGALNWLLVSLLEFDLIEKTLGKVSESLATVGYIVVGLAGLYLVLKALKVLR